LLFGQEYLIILQQVAEIMMDPEKLSRQVSYQLQPLNLMDPATQQIRRTLLNGSNCTVRPMSETIKGTRSVRII
jgi:hypothetical protein